MSFPKLYTTHNRCVSHNYIVVVVDPCRYRSHRNRRCHRLFHDAFSTLIEFARTLHLAIVQDQEKKTQQASSGNGTHRLDNGTSSSGFDSDVTIGSGYEMDAIWSNVNDITGNNDFSNQLNQLPYFGVENVHTSAANSAATSATQNMQNVSVSHAPSGIPSDNVPSGIPSAVGASDALSDVLFGISAFAPVGSSSTQVPFDSATTLGLPLPSSNTSSNGYANGYANTSKNGYANGHANGYASTVNSVNHDLGDPKIPKSDPNLNFLKSLFAEPDVKDLTDEYLQNLLKGEEERGEVEGVEKNETELKDQNNKQTNGGQDDGGNVLENLETLMAAVTEVAGTDSNHNDASHAGGAGEGDVNNDIIMGAELDAQEGGETAGADAGIIMNAPMNTIMYAEGNHYVNNTLTSFSSESSASHALETSGLNSSFNNGKRLSGLNNSFNNGSAFNNSFNNGPPSHELNSFQDTVFSRNASLASGELQYSADNRIDNRIPTLLATPNTSSFANTSFNTSSFVNNMTSPIASPPLQPVHPTLEQLESTLTPAVLKKHPALQYVVKMRHQLSFSLRLLYHVKLFNRMARHLNWFTRYIDINVSGFRKLLKQRVKQLSVVLRKMSGNAVTTAAATAANQIVKGDKSKREEDSEKNRDTFVQFPHAPPSPHHQLASGLEDEVKDEVKSNEKDEIGSPKIDEKEVALFAEATLNRLDLGCTRYHDLVRNYNNDYFVCISCGYSLGFNFK
jgi:hypothetical protein